MRKQHEHVRDETLHERLRLWKENCVIFRLDLCLVSGTTTKTAERNVNG